MARQAVAPISLMNALIKNSEHKPICVLVTSLGHLASACVSLRVHYLFTLALESRLVIHLMCGGIRRRGRRAREGEEEEEALSKIQLEQSST